MPTVDTTVYSIVILAFLGIGVYFIYLQTKFKCRVRVRDLTNNRKIIRDYRAKEHIDKQGVNYWMLAGERNKNRRMLPSPPEESIEIDKKGKKHAECYRTQSNDIIWIADKGNVKLIPQKIYDEIPKWINEIEDSVKKKDAINAWKKKQEKQWRKDNDIIDTFEPLTTKQRMIYLNNLRKAEQRKGFDWKQNLPTMVSLGIAALVVTVLIFGYGEMAEPVIKANQQALDMKKIDLEIVETMKEIKLGQQKIDSQLTQLNQKGVPD